MAVPAESPGTIRWRVRFEAARNFGYDLDKIASPFDRPDTRSAWQANAESAVDYAFQRVLTAFRYDDDLGFPVEVFAWPLEDGIGQYDIVPDLGGERRSILVAIADAPEKDEGLVQDLLKREPAPTDVAIFLDREGNGPVPGSAAPALSEDSEIYAKLKKRSNIGMHFVNPHHCRLFALSEGERYVWLGASYSTDYVGWVFDQATKLQAAVIPGVDCAEVAEELRDLGRKEKHAVRNHLCNLLMHLLKWKYQSDQRSGSWRKTIRNARKQIHRKTSESPGLKSDLNEWFRLEYANARELASDETELPIEVFPVKPPFALDDVLDETWLPDADEQDGN
jgi:hypothetical protein